MSINRIACAAVVMILIAASFLLRTESAAPDGFNFDAAQLNDKTSWTQVNANFPGVR